MVTIMLIAITATGIAMYVIATQNRIGKRLFRFEFHCPETGRKSVYHVRSEGFSAAYEAAKEAVNLQHSENNFECKIAVELNAETEEPISANMVDILQSLESVEKVEIEA